MKTIGYAIVGTGYFGAELGRIMKEQEGQKLLQFMTPKMLRLWQKSLAAMSKRIWISSARVMMSTLCW